MANKEATIFILDVNPSMREKQDEGGKTNHQKAHEALFRMLHSKIITGRKTDFVGMLMVGTEETDNILAEDDQYQHVKVYRFEEDEDALLKAADLQMLRYVDQGTEEGTAIGDVMDGIIIGVKMLETFCRHLKYDKKIYLFTDAENYINTEEIESVVDKAKEMGITFYLIGYDFNAEVKQENNSRLKASNEEFLRTFTEKLEGTFFEGDEASELLEQLRSKSVKPVTLMRGPLTLGDPETHPESSLDITVWVYNKTAEMKLPSAKKWSSLAERLDESERRGDTYGAVTMQRTYKLAAGDGEEGEDGKDEEISQEDLVRAYKYGKNTVPFSTEDEHAMKLHTQKGMSIIGFVKQNAVPRHHLMSNVLAVIPEPGNQPAQRIFNTLIQALDESQNAALVRYVRINDANPKIGVLWPARRGWGWWAQLPFAEDLRPYSFASLDYLVDETPAGMSSASGSTQTLLGSLPGSGPKKRKLDTRQVSKEEALARMDEFIDAMDLMDAVEGDNEKEREAFKPKDIFNPAWQRLYQCIAHRAIHPDASDLPPINPQILACIEPLPDVVKKAEEAAAKLAKCFTITKADKGKLSTKRAWAERAAAAALNPEDVLNRVVPAGEREEATPQLEKKVKVDNMDDLTNLEAPVEKITSSDAVNDFKKMVSRKDVDLVSQAVEQMRKVIVDLVSTSFGDLLYPKAMDCIVVLRDESRAQNEADTFNEWFRDFKRMLTVGDLARHKPFWDLLRKKNISLITHSDDNPEVTVTEEEADKFLRDEEPATTATPAVEEAAEEDDLFDMMD